MKKFIVFILCPLNFNNQRKSNMAKKLKLQNYPHLIHMRIYFPPKKNLRLFSDATLCMTNSYDTQNLIQIHTEERFAMTQVKLLPEIIKTKNDLPD